MTKSVVHLVVNQGPFKNNLFQQSVLLTRLSQGRGHAEVAQGQGETQPHRQLHPDQQACFEGVAVVPDVQFGHDAAQVLLELIAEAGHNNNNNKTTAGLKAPVHNIEIEVCLQSWNSN